MPERVPQPPNTVLAQLACVPYPPVLGREGQPPPVTVLIETMRLNGMDFISRLMGSMPLFLRRRPDDPPANAASASTTVTAIARALSSLAFRCDFSGGYF